MSFQGQERLDPIRECPRGTELARHIGVVQMTVGIDKAGQYDHVAEVDGSLA